MPLVVATHSGPFHADDVMAVALIRQFVASDAVVVRTRDKEVIQKADLVVDVGGVFDPERGRFDHHQAAYEGPLSAAGMVLAWLGETERLEQEWFIGLRTEVMSYLDDVDNGRRPPDPEVLCFPRIVEALGQGAEDGAGFDRAFDTAVSFASAFLEGWVAGRRAQSRARCIVEDAMLRAEEENSNLMFFDAYLKWKEPYFANGGEHHATEYVLFPGAEEHWRVVAIPPRLGEFGQKRSLPESWAGLTDEALEEQTGVSGSIFCHKNRFIAVFTTREKAVEALKREGLLVVGG